MSERVCLITGATNGIGKETARGLAATGATTIVVGRDPMRTEATVAEIRASTDNQQVDGIVADLSSQREVRELVARVRSAYPRLHVLVNNAGVFMWPRVLTVDGIECQWAVNQLAYYMIAESLADLLCASAPARIINVTSSAHFDGDIDFDDLQGTRRYSGVRAYNQSKLANVLYTYDFARRLAGSGVTVNCLHPGIVATGIAMNNGGLIRLAVQIRGLFVRGPRAGAQTSIYLASSPDVAHISGAFFVDCRRQKSAPKSYDQSLQKRVRDVCAEMTGVAAVQGGAPIQP